MEYKHRVVQGLAELIDKYGGGGKDPMMRAVWFGIKGQVPLLLKSLDESEEAIKLIEDKLREVLGVEPEAPTAPSVPRVVSEKEPPKPKRIAFIGKKTPGKRRRRVVEEPVAEAEVTVELAVEYKKCPDCGASYSLEDFGSGERCQYCLKEESNEPS